MKLKIISLLNLTLEYTPFKHEKYAKKKNRLHIEIQGMSRGKTLMCLFEL